MKNLPVYLAALTLFHFGGCGSDQEPPASQKLEKSSLPAKENMPGFRALGDEPFWNADISPEGIVFSEMGIAEKIIFPYAAPELENGKHIYISAIEKPEPHQIKITIEAKECVDNMAGTPFDYTAEVELNHQTYSGCAAKKLTPEQTINKYIQSIRAGDLNGVLSVLPPETDFQLPGPVAVKEYEIIEKQTLTAENITAFSFKPQPQAGDLRMVVRQVMPAATVYQEEKFIYFLRQIGGVWRIYVWSVEEGG